MEDFKVGDKVKCIDPPGAGQLVEGEVYEITYIEYMPGTTSRVQLVSLNKWPLMLWNGQRFNLADE